MEGGLIEHFYQDIQGWFQCQGLYDLVVRQAVDGAVFVEVGAWKGRSAAYMAVEILNSGKKIDFFVVDTFEGSEEHREDEVITRQALYETFTENMKPVEKAVNVLRMASLGAALMFEDGCLDFCYIDAAHDYESVRADILAWLPKMKPGAMLAGDDYAFPGVFKAVWELLPGFFPIGGYWMYRIPA